jgi:hypothetical protein
MASPLLKSLSTTSSTETACASSLERLAKNKTFSQYHLKDILSDLGSNLNEYINYLGIK